MNKDFIPYEEALALKELGFDEDCFRLYNQNDLSIENPLTPTTSKNSDRILYASKRIAAPLYQQAFRWFREKYDLRSIEHYKAAIKTEDKIVIGYKFGIFKSGEISTIDVIGETYEEAEINCLKKMIEIVKFHLHQNPLNQDKEL